MKKKQLNPDPLHHHPAYSRVVSVEKVGRMHFIAGCTAADKDYNVLHKGDLVKQYYTIMEQLEGVLAACGATWEDVVMRRIYVLDMDAFLTKVQTDPKQKLFWEKGNHPPCTLVEVSRLSNKDFLIEIDLIACTET